MIWFHLIIFDSMQTTGILGVFGRYLYIRLAEQKTGNTFIPVNVEFF